MNLLVSNKYSETTKHAMSQLSEKELSFELVVALLKYITGVYAFLLFFFSVCHCTICAFRLAKLPGTLQINIIRFVIA